MWIIFEVIFDKTVKQSEYKMKIWFSEWQNEIGKSSTRIPSFFIFTYGKTTKFWTCSGTSFPLKLPKQNPDSLNHPKWLNFDPSLSYNICKSLFFKEFCFNELGNILQQFSKFFWFSSVLWL